MRQAKKEGREGGCASPREGRGGESRRRGSRQTQGSKSPRERKGKGEITVLKNHQIEKKKKKEKRRRKVTFILLLIIQSRDGSDTESGRESDTEPMEDNSVDKNDKENAKVRP